MKEHVFSEALQQLATLLDRAKREGQVRIQRGDGEVFVLRPERAAMPATNGAAISLGLTRWELLELIRAERKK